jgi:SAM-dependent methyltransferase
VRRNQIVWNTASRKHDREYADLLEQARSGSALLPRELDVLRPVLGSAPEVVHLQSGCGIDDVALVAAGAQRVVGVDFSAVAASSAQRRADDLGVACRYLVAEVPGVPLRDGCADLVYTGKGALIWMRDLTAWAADVARLLRPSGHLFVYEGHPMVPLWAWDEDDARIRPDRSYFARTFVNDTYPALGAVEWQWSLGEIVTAVVAAGLEVIRLSEHPEPFWQPADVDAAAWRGRLPNAFMLLARVRAGGSAPRPGSPRRTGARRAEPRR